MTPVRRYLESYRESLLAEYRLAQNASDHSGDLGENYEKRVVDFLSKVMPRRLLAARGGSVIGVAQPASKQIDVLVTHDTSTDFRADEKTYRIVEGVVAAVAVKSNLTSAGIEEDCKVLASLPSLSKSAIATAAVPLNSFFSDYSERFPKRIIWGWTGPTLETVQSALVEASKGIDPSKRPDLVLVLDRGLTVSRNGELWFAWGPQDGPAIGLARIVDMMAAAAGWAACFNVKLGPYWND